MSKQNCTRKSEKIRGGDPKREASNYCENESTSTEENCDKKQTKKNKQKKKNPNTTQMKEQNTDQLKSGVNGKN